MILRSENRQSVHRDVTELAYGCMIVPAGQWWGVWAGCSQGWFKMAAQQDQSDGTGQGELCLVIVAWGFL